LAGLIPNVRPTRHVSIHVLPFTWYLLGEVVNAGGASATGGRSSKLRKSVADLITVLYEVVGPELQSAAEDSPDVTPSMQSLLGDLIGETT